MTRSDHGGGGASKRDDEAALAALQAHFANSFDAAPIRAVSSSSSVKGKQKQVQEEKTAKKERTQQTATRQIAETLKPTALRPTTQRAPPETIVFGDPSTSNDSIRTGGWRKFMSAKVETRKDSEPSKKPKKVSADSGGGGEEDEETEKQMMSNDRALSDLLSTTLFAPGAEGSADAARKRANGKPNLSSNATLSRLLELSRPALTDRAASVGRGLGGSLRKADELNRMPATMRHGMRRAEQDRQARDVEQAKELGLYHSSIKRVFGKGADGQDLVLGTRDKARKARTRQKGMAMGVGTFAGGTLRLSKDEVERINGGKRGGGGSAPKGKRKRD